MENILTWAMPFITEAFTNYPVVASVVFIMGSARVIMKPLFKLLEAIAEVTKTKKDNELIAAVKANKAFKSVMWVLDYVFSLKLGKEKK